MNKHDFHPILIITHTHSAWQDFNVCVYMLPALVKWDMKWDLKIKAKKGIESLCHMDNFYRSHSFGSLSKSISLHWESVSFGQCQQISLFIENLCHLDNFNRSHFIKQSLCYSDNLNRSHFIESLCHLDNFISESVLCHLDNFNRSHFSECHLDNFSSESVSFGQFQQNSLHWVSICVIWKNFNRSHFIECLCQLDNFSRTHFTKNLSLSFWHFNRSNFTIKSVLTYSIFTTFLY